MKKRGGVSGEKWKRF